MSTDALSTSETLLSLPAVNQDDKISVRSPTQTTFLHEQEPRLDIVPFLFWAHFLEQSAFVSQTVADSDWLQT